MNQIRIVTETRQESRTYKAFSGEPTTVTENRTVTHLEYDDIEDVTDLASVLMSSSVPKASAPDFLGLVIKALPPVAAGGVVPTGGILTGRRPWS